MVSPKPFEGYVPQSLVEYQDTHKHAHFSLTDAPSALALSVTTSVWDCCKHSFSYFFRTWWSRFVRDSSNVARNDNAVNRGRSCIGNIPKLFPTLSYSHRLFRNAHYGNGNAEWEYIGTIIKCCFSIFTGTDIWRRNSSHRGCSISLSSILSSSARDAFFQIFLPRSVNLNDQAMPINGIKGVDAWYCEWWVRVPQPVCWWRSKGSLQILMPLNNLKFFFNIRTLLFC